MDTGSVGRVYSGTGTDDDDDEDDDDEEDDDDGVDGGETEERTAVVYMTRS